MQTGPLLAAVTLGNVWLGSGLVPVKNPTQSMQMAFSDKGKFILLRANLVSRYDEKYGRSKPDQGQSTKWPPPQHRAA